VIAISGLGGLMFRRSIAGWSTAASDFWPRRGEHVMVSRWLSSILAGVLASTSVCFDLSIFELFVPLSWGGTVILADNAVDIPALPAGRKISLINTVPSAIKDLLKAGTIPSSVTTVNLAGEKLSTQIVQQLYSPPNIRKVYDLYGPSEATTYATYALRAADGAATIGRPVANTQIYILDPEIQPCPIGVPGEIYIGGDCLARGYLNGPELTAQKFVPVKSPGPMSMSKAKALALYAPRPQYPYEARSRHVTGSGVIVCTMDSGSGNVGGCSVSSSTGSPILDNAATSAFRQWRFRPGTVSKVNIPITFTMTGASY